LFYIYEHIRSDTNAIFYVGKGKGNRCNDLNNRNKHWKNIVYKANGFTARKIVQDIDEELALLCEQERIDQLKRLGVKLCNMTNGGEGTSGRVLSEESKAKIGVRHSQESYDRALEKRKTKYPFTVEHKTNLSLARIGEKNYMFGKTHSLEAREKIRQSRFNAPRLTCTFCDKVGDSANMTRWHFDRCKFKGKNI
jgi:hypothetical protein